MKFSQLFASKFTRIVLGIGIFLVIAGSLVAAIYFYRQYRLLVNDSVKAEEMQHAYMLKTMATLIELPNEKPSIVTITDREKLQSQAFFQKALNGDKIIIYEAAKRVYLYRPSTKKVIDVAPLVLNDTQGTQSEAEVFNQTLLPQPTATSTATPKLDGPTSSPSSTPSPTITP